MSIRPITYKVFKGMGGGHGAVNFSLSAPHFYRGTEKNFTGYDGENKQAIYDGKDGWKLRDGCVFVEMAPTIGKNVYDWDNKITFALSVNDMSQLLLGLRTGDEVKLMHDPGAGTDNKGQVSKYMTFNSPNGTKIGGFLYLTQIINDDKRNYKVPLSGAEVVALGELLRVALTRALAW